MADSIEVIVARIDERLSALKQQIEVAGLAEAGDLSEIKKSVEALSTRIKTIEDMATRYRGGFITVLSLGGIFGWVAANYDFFKTIGSWFKGS